MNKKTRALSLFLLAIMLGATVLGYVAMIAHAADVTLNSQVKLYSVDYSFNEVGGGGTINGKTYTNMAGYNGSSSRYEIRYNGYLTDADGYIDKTPLEAYATSSEGEIFRYGNMDVVLTLIDENIKLDSDAEDPNLKYENALTKINDGDIFGGSNALVNVDFSTTKKENIRTSGNQNYAVIKVYFEDLQYADNNDTSKIYFTLVYNSNSNENRYYYENLGYNMPGAQKGKFSVSTGGGSSSDDDDDNNTGVRIDAATPYIIISDYSIGSDSVTAGDTFTLDLTIRNTHRRVNVENILMTISTDDGLQLTSSSNTKYIDRLRNDSPYSTSIQVTALPNATVQSHTISIEFLYEYIADDARQTGQTRETITVPVIQRDRFNAALSSVTTEIWPGEEGELTVSYVNRGRSELYNLTAEIICDSISGGSQQQNLGNIAAGNSGEADFYLAPTVTGEFSGEVLFTYEDANANLKEFRVPFTSTALEPQEETYDPGIMDPGMMDPTDPAMGGEIEEPTPKWVYAAIGGGALLVVLIAVSAIRRHKRNAEIEDDE